MPHQISLDPDRKPHNSIYSVCRHPAVLNRSRGYIYNFFKLNSAEHKIFSANIYENANNSWRFHIYKQRKFHAHLCLARKNLQLLVF